MAETIDVLEAARRLGVTPDAVRARLRRGTLEGYRDNSGNWRIVSNDTTSDTMADTTPEPHRHDTNTTRHDSVSPDLTRLLTKLVEQIEDNQKRLDADQARLLENNARLIEERASLSGKCDQLQDELQRVQADADHANADQARMAKDVARMFDELKALADRHAELQADRARLQADLEQARAELARARQPWWKRLIS